MVTTERRATKLAEVLRREHRSQVWLAKAIDYSIAYCWLVISGRRVAAALFYERAARALGVLPDELIEESGVGGERIESGSL